MKLRSSQTSTDQSEQSLIVFCANYKKEKLEKIRRKYQNRNCLKCIGRSLLRTKTHSTPVVTRRERHHTDFKPSQNVSKTFTHQNLETRTRHQTPEHQNLFYTTISPISTNISPRHNTEERIKRENTVRRNLFEKSLQAIIEEARKELLVEKLSRSLNNALKLVF